MLRPSSTIIAIATLTAVALPALAQDAPKASTEAPSAETVTQRVQEFYGKTTDYQASFKQTYHDLAAGADKVTIGKVYFKKPGKMRWDYKKADTKKMDKLYVSDGSSFWVYEYEFKQVFKQCLKDSQLPTSLSFLMGTGNLLDEFNVSFSKKSTAKKPELTLLPKQPTSKFKEITFTLDPQTYQVLRTVIHDPYGNMNEIEFSRAAVNKNLPDSGFDFQVPKGARVLNPQQKCS